MEKEKKSILVVDDDKNILESFKSILESEGYCVDMVESGREAIEKSKAKFYNLALMDIKLPYTEGTDLLTNLHRDTTRMMKIMVTGYPSLENAVKSLNLGADAYIIKPVDPEELLKLVEEKLVEQKQAEKMSEEKVAEWIESRIRKLQSQI